MRVLKGFVIGARDRETGGSNDLFSPIENSTVRDFVADAKGAGCR